MNGDGAWADAEDLEVGDYLLTPDGVTKIDRIGERVVADHTVHNLTIADIYTYHVNIGNHDVLTHNTNELLCGDSFEVTVGELADELTIVGSHPTNDLQRFGGPEVGRGGVRNLSNDDLVRPGGPRGDDPISGLRG